MTEKTKTVLSGLKEKVANVCNAANERIADGLRRTHCVEGCAFLMKGCAFQLCEMYCEKGYNVQQFFFSEKGSEGILVQIENSRMEWKDDLLRSLGGQRLAVNVRFVSQGNNLDVSIGNGKWLDKTFSGVLAWTIAAPLVVFPVIGLWRQKQLIGCVEHDIMEWLAVHRQDECIDVSTSETASVSG